MDYKILDWNAANELKDKMKATFVVQPDFNFSKVYLLSDSSYLIMPLNPFGNSVLTGRKDLLDKWIGDQRFPINDEANKFYFDNQDKIDNLIATKETLKQSLCNYAFMEEGKEPNNLSLEEMDSVYKLLKKRKKYQEYKLNFIVLVGDYILNQHMHGGYHWGLSRSKQLLNPLISLIIITDEKEKRYYDIEDKISGKFGYVGVQYYLKSMSDGLMKRANEIEEIKKIM